MGDHQPDESKTEDTVSEGQTSTASTDEKRVPLSELVKQRQAAAEAKRQAEEQAERIKELEEQLAAAGKVTTDDVPPKPDDASRHEDPARSKLDEILRKDAIRDLRDEHGLSLKQAEHVHDILERMPDLNYDEAYAIAASRHIDVFADSEDGATGYSPSIHGATRPRPQGQPAAADEPDTRKRLEAITKLRRVDKQAASRLWSNLVGNIAAQQVGLTGHKRLDIPQD